MNGADLIKAERERQVSKEGWTAEHDDRHYDGALAMAACCYARHALYSEYDPIDGGDWPWEAESWKPCAINHASHETYDIERNLIKAGALIAAEIDRLQRERGAE